MMGLATNTPLVAARFLLPGWSVPMLFAGGALLLTQRQDR